MLYKLIKDEKRAYRFVSISSIFITGNIYLKDIALKSGNFKTVF